MNTKEVTGFILAEKRVLVVLVPNTTSSGLTTSVEKSKDRGIVVGRGEECEKEHSIIGNDILFNPFAVKEINVDGRTLTMINEDQIYGVFKTSIE